EGVVGGKIDLTLENLLESGEVIHPALTQTNYKIEPENGIAMVDDSLHLYEAGEYVVVAETTYEDITILSNEVVITVTDNSAIEPIQSLIPVNVSTEIGVMPELPDVVYATYETLVNMPQSVTWGEISEEDINQFGEFVVTGHVEGTEIEAVANVTVEGYVGIQQFSVATPIQKPMELPAHADAYHNSGRVDTFEIEWEDYDSELLNQVGTFEIIGKLVGTHHTTKITVRVTDEFQQGSNIAQIWTGSEIPAAIASFT